MNVTAEKHSPTKRRYSRANQALYVIKKPNMEIMKRSRLKNKFLNTRKNLDSKPYNRQRIYAVNLLRKGKMEFYGSLNTSILTEAGLSGKLLNLF